jgi:hypothetical protein
MLFLEQRDSSSKWANAVRTVVGVSSRMRDRCAAQSITPQPHHRSQYADPSRYSNTAAKLLVKLGHLIPLLPSASPTLGDCPPSRQRTPQTLQLVPPHVDNYNRCGSPHGRRLNHTRPPTPNPPDRCRLHSRSTSASTIILRQHNVPSASSPPKAFVVVDVRRTDQSRAFGVAAKEPPGGASLSSKLIPSGDL